MLIAEFQQYLFGFSIFITSLFLVMLVLVQRGRGGGLTGALGGAGGQSAFGTKAGDLFTKITVGVAALWIFLCAAAVFFLKDRALPQTNVADRSNSAVVGAKDPGTVPTSDSAAGASSGVTDAATPSTGSTVPNPVTNNSATTSPATTNAATDSAEASKSQSKETPATEKSQAEITTLPNETNQDEGAAPAATGQSPKSN